MIFLNLQAVDFPRHRRQVSARADLSHRQDEDIKYTQHSTKWFNYPY